MALNPEKVCQEKSKNYTAIGKLNRSQGKCANYIVLYNKREQAASQVQNKDNCQK